MPAVNLTLAKLGLLDAMDQRRFVRKNGVQFFSGDRAQAAASTESRPAKGVLRIQPLTRLGRFHLRRPIRQSKYGQSPFKLKA